MEALRTDKGDEGEMIEGAETVTFVLLIPGYSGRDIRVKAEPDRLRVDAFDLAIVRPLGCTVDTTTVRSTYVNGVLSVRVDKKL